MTRWRKSQRRAFVEKYGEAEGVALLRWLKIHAARARWATMAAAIPKKAR
jgi:hypothetical protein